MDTPAVPAGSEVDSLPTADFFGFESMLNAAEQEKLAELREFLASEVAPFAAEWWNRAEFPAHILPKLAALELSTPRSAATATCSPGW